MIDYIFKNTRQRFVIYFVIVFFLVIELYFVFFTVMPFTIPLSLFILECVSVIFLVMILLSQGLQHLIQKIPNILYAQDCIAFIEQDKCFQNSIIMQIRLANAYFYCQQIEKALSILRQALHISRRKDYQALIYCYITRFYFFEEQYSLGIETLHITQQLCQKNTFLLKMINIDLEDLYNRLKKQYLYKQGEISDQERILDLQERLIKENGDVCS